jgi:hypothetical protein
MFNQDSIQQYGFYHHQLVATVHMHWPTVLLAANVRRAQLLGHAPPILLHSASDEYL